MTTFYHLHVLLRMISFLAGKPNPSTFPFEAITLTIKPGLDSSASTNGATKEPEQITISGKELDEALQYGATAGLPVLVKVYSLSDTINIFH